MADRIDWANLWRLHPDEARRQIREMNARTWERGQVWRPYYPPAGEPWHVRAHFALVRWARIPELGELTGDHRGWGGWRWLYVVPFVWTRYALLRLDRGVPPTALRDTWAMSTEWWPRTWWPRRLWWWYR